MAIRVISDKAQTKASTQSPLDAKETADKVHSQAVAGEEHVAHCGTNTDPNFLEVPRPEPWNTKSKGLSHCWGRI